jgi:hypothetical protein
VEIARWWKERTRLEVGAAQMGRGKYRVLPPSDARSQLDLVTPLTGAHLSVAAGYEVASSGKPMIGVHPEAGNDLIHKIRDMGYVIEKSENSAVYPYYVNADSEVEEVRSRIGRLDHPLLMDTHWPGPFESALTVTGDIDCLTLGDFLRRFREG